MPRAVLDGQKRWERLAPDRVRLLEDGIAYFGGEQMTETMAHHPRPKTERYELVGEWTRRTDSDSGLPERIARRLLAKLEAARTQPRETTHDQPTELDLLQLRIEALAGQGAEAAG
jgi:hypothetical protein